MPDALSPTVHADHFAVFGLSRRLHLDLAALEKEFYRQSRKLHPDRFARAAATEQQAALQRTSQLNDAYRTLAEPIPRIAYLLELEGVRRRDERVDADGGRANQVPTELLEEVFELNMALDEARSGGLDDPGTRRQLAEAQEDFQSKLGTVDTALLERAAAWDRARDAGESGGEILQQISGLLDRRNYLQNLLRDVAAVLSPTP